MSPLYGVRAIYISAMCISSSVFDFPLTSNVGDRSLNPKCTYLGCLGPVHCGARGRWHSMLTRSLSHCRYLYRVRVWIGVGGALVWAVLGRSWGGFAHVATVTLSWRVRDFVVIGGVRVGPEGVIFWSDFGFGPGHRWWDRHQSCEICTCTLILMTRISFYFCYTPVWKTDVLCRGNVRPSVRPSVCPSVRPSVRVFRTFLQHALRYQFETWYIHSVGGTTCRVWVASQLGHFDLVYSQK